jgi:hypothetical protein
MVVKKIYRKPDFRRLGRLRMITFDYNGVITF